MPRTQPRPSRTPPSTPLGRSQRFGGLRGDAGPRPLLPLFGLLALLATAACGDDGTGPDDLGCTGGSPLSVGGTINGTLANGDMLDVDGAYLDRFALAVADDGPLEISMTSDDIDAFLWLLDADGGVLDADDDGGSDTDALMTLSLNRGCYLLEATSATEGETGAYTLRIRRG